MITSARTVAPWVVGLGVLCVSTAAPLVRLAAAPPLAIAFYRLAFSALLLLPAWGGRGERWPGKKSLAWSLFAGFCLGAHWALWFAALQHTSVASATVLVTLHPVFVLAGNWLLWRVRYSWRVLAVAGVAIAGGVLIAAGDTAGRGGLYGDVLALAAALAMAVYLLVGERLRGSVDLLAYVVPVYGSGAVLTALLAALFGVPLGGFAAKEWWLFLALAIVPTLGGHTTFNWALRYMPASRISTAVLGEPVAATALSALLFGEIPGAVQVLGSIFVLLGVAAFFHISAREELQ